MSQNRTNYIFHLIYFSNYKNKMIPTQKNIFETVAPPNPRHRIGGCKISCI
jgi:hypothetical protein